MKDNARMETKLRKIHLKQVAAYKITCVTVRFYFFSLVSGDVEGHFTSLFKRVSSIQKKSGVFDVRIYLHLYMHYQCTLSI